MEIVQIKTDKQEAILMKPKASSLKRSVRLLIELIRRRKEKTNYHYQE